MYVFTSEGTLFLRWNKFSVSSSENGQILFCVLNDLGDWQAKKAKYVTLKCLW